MSAGSQPGATGSCEQRKTEVHTTFQSNAQWQKAHSIYAAEVYILVHKHSSVMCVYRKAYMSAFEKYRPRAGEDL